MLFNSLAYLAFFPVFLASYYLTRGQTRLWVCLVGSYVFYGWWDWRFLGLIAFSTAVDFVVAQRIPASRGTARQQLLVVSLATNLGILGFFKYFNFFEESVRGGLETLGLAPSAMTLDIVLPVGISFYTFQKLSYTIDVHRGEIEPEPSLLRFASYVALFPQLVAGPIVRAAHLLPQLRSDHALVPGRFRDGTVLILWGLFKKVVVADTIAVYVEAVFQIDPRQSPTGSVLGIYFYAFQIYCDFSGYSDIAIGTAAILGLHFPVNFDRPYFSASFREFWTRWHISLSSWLRDYLYIPLGGNREGWHKTYRNLMVTMLLGGLWHGAAWTFVAWGALHGSYLIAERFLTARLGSAGWWLRIPPALRRGLAIILVFHLTCLAWVFFRAPDFTTAWVLLDRIADGFRSGFGGVTFQRADAALNLALIATVVAVDGISLARPVREAWERRPFGLREAMAAVLIASIAALGTFQGAQFIYFQF